MPSHYTIVHFQGMELGKDFAMLTRVLPSSRSSIDTLWNYLLEDPNDPFNVAFKEAFGSKIDRDEDLEARGFSLIHLIVFGFSTIGLEDYLATSTDGINEQCSIGRTPLAWASGFRNDYKKVQLLVAHGAALDIPDSRGQTAVHFAAETGCYESLALVLAVAARLQDRNEHNHQLRDAVRHMSFSQDEKLDFASLTVRLNDPMPFVSLFCRDLVEQTDYKGRTALHLATRLNQKKHAELLIEHGANIDHPDTVLGRTPLFIALYWNCHDVLLLLLRNHARLDVVDGNRMTVLHYAAKYADTESLRILSSESITGVSPHMRDFQNYTPPETFHTIRPEMLRETSEQQETSSHYFDMILEKCTTISKA